MLPSALQETVEFFEHLSEPERRDELREAAETAVSWVRNEGESYELADVRKDRECSDTVGVFVRRDGQGRVHFRVELGPKVQTLTRAMTVILCRGLDGCTPQEILAVNPDFVPRIVGADLIRLRSQTVYYVLQRMKEAMGKLPPL